MAPEDVLNSVDESRREFLRMVIAGTVFAVPLMASFSMDGLSPDAADAQPIIPNQQPPSVQIIQISPRKIHGIPTFQAKFICGTASGAALIGRGRYFTSLNIRNTTDKSLTFTQKVVQTYPNSTISPPNDYLLDPEAGLEIDCSQIPGYNPNSLLEGFIVITAPDEKLDALEMVAVYTAQGVF